MSYAKYKDLGAGEPKQQPNVPPLPPMNSPPQMMQQPQMQPSNYPNLAPQQFNPRPQQPQQNMGEFVPTISSLEEKRKFIQGNTICVVDVYGDWCGPCKSIAPKYADMFKKYAKPGLCV